jgi:hypothetical protein
MLALFAPLAFDVIDALLFVFFLVVGKVMAVVVLVLASKSTQFACI